MVVASNYRSSVIVAFDGESKCGKTTYAEAVADGAQYQKDLYGGIGLSDELLEEMRSHEGLESLMDTGFHGITTISAGNLFRAAALYTIIEEKQGRNRSSFSPEDASRLRDMLREDGVIDVLQNDQEVGSRVSQVAQFAGVQALCGTTFCKMIEDAYFEDGGHNIVIVDARDPIGHMKRNNMLGLQPGKVIPLSVIGVYIETPADDAARRMKGQFEDNIQTVKERRHSDATREELPVTPPSFTAPINEWYHAIPFWDGSTISSLEEMPPLLHIDNGSKTTLEHIRYVGDILSASATMAAYAIDEYLRAKNLQLQFNLK